MLCIRILFFINEKTTNLYFTIITAIKINMQDMATYFSEDGHWKNM